MSDAINKSTENKDYIKLLAQHQREKLLPLSSAAAELRKILADFGEAVLNCREKIAAAELELRLKAEAEEQKKRKAEEEAAPVPEIKSEGTKPAEEAAPAIEVKKEPEPIKEAVAEAQPSAVETPAEEPRCVYIPPEKSAQTQVGRVYIPTDSPRQRPQGQSGPQSKYPPRPPRPGMKPVTPAVAPPPIPAGKTKTGDKKTKPMTAEEKHNANKRSLMKKNIIVEDFSQTKIDEEGDIQSRIRIKGKTKKNEFIQPVNVKIESAVITTSIIPIKVLSEKIGKTGPEIVKKLFSYGILKTINDSVDFETAERVAADFDVILSYEPPKTFEDALVEAETEADNPEDLVPRPPVVTILGHVDHGKTSLLDYIRRANVASGEAGGITQHIGAYTVTLGSPITFLDTPGHEAFTAMRARGAQVTDVAVLVVAADDGVMPQTIEALNHAKAAGVEIVVAINKIDKPAADPQRIMQDLTAYDIIAEEWGGTTPFVKVSAKTGQGVNDLLETILLVAEMKQLMANPKKPARGTIIEASRDKSRGPLATVLVQSGTLRTGDYAVAGTRMAKLRSMIDDKGRTVKEAGPSIPVSVMGFSEVPNAGDALIVVKDEHFAKQIIAERLLKEQESRVITTPGGVFPPVDEIKEYRLIIKADVQGSVEAIIHAMEKFANEPVNVNIIHSGVGAINETDVMLAETSNAKIIGFNVRTETKAKAVAEQKNVAVSYYRIIYEMLDDIESELKGMRPKKYKDTVLGEAEVRSIYRISNVGTVAGCYVTDGKMVRSARVRLSRDGKVVYEGEVLSLKRFKDDVKEVAKGYECGISIVNYNDIKEGDLIESYIIEEIKDAD
ncbi:MAG TPA: translation initiation factor IF-2 [Eubacteriales bacterium]|nr:translation initiation factor IF-2 [Eubacteriales bacterium]